MNTSYKRILLKLSGEVFQDKSSGQSLHAETINRIASEINEVHQLGVEIALVVGGGNIFRGLSGENFGIDRNQGDYIGMLATCINALALQAALENLGTPVRVQTALDIRDVAEPFIRRKAIRHLEKGRIVIFGGGTGNPHFTTDTAAALRASEIHADAVLKGTKVDGVYDKDPMKHDDALRYQKVSYKEAIAKRLGVMDTAAFSLCMDNGIPIVVFNFFNEGDFLRVANGEDVGTVIG